MILNRQRAVRVTLWPLEEFLGRVQRALRVPDRGVTICLMSDPAIARLNRVFRGKVGPTDVLSFPADGFAVKHGRKKVAKRPPAYRARQNGNRLPRTGAADYLGDIAISPETARRNARRLGRALPDELRLLVLHGVLHLLGYDHETDNGRMERLERRLRRRLGLR